MQCIARVPRLDGGKRAIRQAPGSQQHGSMGGAVGMLIRTGYLSRTMRLAKPWPARDHAETCDSILRGGCGSGGRMRAAAAAVMARDKDRVVA